MAEKKKKQKKKIKRLPVFVYGSLMSGMHNAKLIPEDFIRVNATLYGYDMYPEDTAIYFNTYPFIVSGEGTVKGELVYPSAECDDTDYTHFVGRLDKLERVDIKLYIRKEVEVETETGDKITAWAYIGKIIAHNLAYNLIPKVKDGDWKSFKMTMNSFLKGEATLEDLRKKLKI